MKMIQNLIVGLAFTGAIWTLLSAFRKEERESTKCAKCNCQTGGEKCKTI